MEIVIVAVAIALILGVIAMKNLVSLVIKALLIGVILIGGLILLKNMGHFDKQTPGQRLDQFIDRFDDSEYTPYP